MSWLSNFFNPGKEEREEREELEDAYNEAVQADVSTSTLETLEQEIGERGYKLHWNGQYFEMVVD